MNKVLGDEPTEPAPPLRELPPMLPDWAHKLGRRVLIHLERLGQTAPLRALRCPPTCRRVPGRHAVPKPRGPDAPTA